MTNVKTSHEGRTGHQYINLASVACSGAGVPEIWYGSGSILSLSASERHLVVDYGGRRTLLRISKRDQDRMRALIAERDELANREITEILDLKL
jgi:hypothetical protein